MIKIKYLLKEVNIEKIVFDETNPRLIKNENVEKLANNIAEVGLLNPILVRKILNTDTYKLIDGERRLRATRFLEWQNIKCVVLTCKEDNLIYQLSIAFSNKNIPVFPDKAKALSELQEKLKIDKRTLSRKLSIDESYVDKLINYWHDFGQYIKGVDKNIRLRLLPMQVATQFQYLSSKERFELAQEIQDFIDKKRITTTRLVNMIKYFRVIPKEDQLSVPQLGFKTALHWVESMKKEKIERKYRKYCYIEVYKQMSKLIIHLGFFIDNIVNKSYNLDEKEYNNIKILIEPLYLKLTKFFEKERK